MNTRYIILSAVSMVAMLLADISIAPLILHAQSPPTVRTLSLEEALALASGGSEEIQAARAGVERAEGNQEIARSQFFPQINLTAGYTRTLLSQYSSVTTPSIPGNDSTGEGSESFFSDLPFGQKNQYSIGLTLSQVIFAGGRLTAQSDAAAASRHIADIGLTAAQAQLMLDVIQSYYDAVLSDQLVTIADSSLAQAEEIFRQTDLAWKVGEKAEYESLRARVARDNQIPVLLQNRTNRSIAYMRLKQLLNISLDDSLNLTSGVGDLNPRFAAAGDTSVDQRAGVRQAVETINANEAQLRAAQGERLPQISLSSRYAPVAYPENIFPSFDDFRNDWTVGINLSIPIFTGGRIDGSEKVAQATLNESQARLRQTREAAALDARVAQSELAQAEAILASTRSTAEQADRAYQIAGVRFREGISTQIELADARLLREQALANQARAQRNMQVARVKLALLRDLPLSAGGSAASQAAQAQQQNQTQSTQSSQAAQQSAAGQNAVTGTTTSGGY